MHMCPALTEFWDAANCRGTYDINARMYIDISIGPP